MYRRYRSQLEVCSSQKRTSPIPILPRNGFTFPLNVHESQQGKKTVWKTPPLTFCLHFHVHQLRHPSSHTLHSVQDHSPSAHVNSTQCLRSTISWRSFCSLKGEETRNKKNILWKVDLCLTQTQYPVFAGKEYKDFSHCIVCYNFTHILLLFSPCAHPILVCKTFS